MRPLEVRESALVLGVPDRFFRDWVDDHYRALLEATLARRRRGPGQRVAYEVVEVALRRRSPLTHTRRQGGRAARAPAAAQPALHLRHLRGGGQQPAARGRGRGRGRTAPGRAYNPLFIYGGTGLGKTHLLHAVGNHIWEKDPSQRVVYLSSEQFTNEYVESVREHRMTDFRRKFREECDVLLIDDIQFLGKREETQKEFFYTFNTLLRDGQGHRAHQRHGARGDPGPGGAAAQPLRDGPASRTSASPNYETRVAILKKKAEAERLHAAGRRGALHRASTSRRTCASWRARW